MGVEPQDQGNAGRRLATTTEMDVRVLQELIECSVCFERMGPNSKVLPCQHTFCQPCLESIVRTRGELRCPECRVLVTVPVVDLPANILLIRLLDSLKVVGGAVCSDQTSTNSEVVQDLQSASGAVGPLPSARALYDYCTQEPNDLSFKKGDRIILRKRVDANWLFGESGGRMGFFPTSYVQVLVPLPVVESSTPRGRALYDFELSGDEKDCLKLRKNDIVSIIRRIDGNWLEGRLGDRVGIFPISYVKLNEAAKNLLKGPDTGATVAVSSRLVPPTPSAVEPVAQVAIVSSNSNNDEPTYANVARAANLPTAVSTSQDFVAASRTSARSTLDKNSPKRHSASSFSSTPVPPCDGAAAQRHSMEILRTEITAQPPRAAQPPPAAAMGVPSQAQACPSPPSRNQGPHSVPAAQKYVSGATVSTQVIPIHVAMFNYKPQRDDELELEKGKLYKVSDMCRDGWYRGVCLSTGRSGVFPGNYVQSVIGLPKANGEQQQQRSPSSLRVAAPCSPPAAAAHPDGGSLVVQPQAAAADADETPLSSSAGDATDTSAGRPGLDAVSASGVQCTGTAVRPLATQTDKNKVEKGSSDRVSSPRRPAQSSVEAAKSNQALAAATIGRSGQVTVAAATVVCADPTQGHHGRATSLPVVCNVAATEPTVNAHQAERILKSRRKAGSLDSTLDDQLKPRTDGSPKAIESSRQAVRVVPPERYRCIVPYPAQCDADTELMIGDVVLVHKKRYDGWYKGAHQRTGKQGLFPASFLERC